MCFVQNNNLSDGDTLILCPATNSHQRANFWHSLPIFKNGTEAAFRYFAALTCGLADFSLTILRTLQHPDPPPSSAVTDNQRKLFQQEIFQPKFPYENGSEARLSRLCQPPHYQNKIVSRKFFVVFHAVTWQIILHRMKSLQNLVIVVLGVASLAITVAVVWLNTNNRALAKTLQSQQLVINSDRTTSQIGRTILKDVAQLALDKNDKDLLELLKKNGVTVTPKTIQGAAK
jgi:hypothetical protein